MRFPFALKLGIAVSSLAVLTTGLASYWIFHQGRSIVIDQMSNRLKDIGRAGSYLFQEQEIDALKELLEQVSIHSSFNETKEQLESLNSEEIGSYESIPASVSSQTMKSSSFQKIVQILRWIREGTRDEIYPKNRQLPALDVIRKKSNDIPSMEYVYLLTPVKDFPTSQYLLYLVDSDYLPADDDGTGEPYEGNPIGNITRTLTPEMGMGFSGNAITEQDFTRDQWGDVVISGYVPILDRTGKILCVLGMDYNVEGSANKISLLRNFCIAAVLFAFLLSIFVAFVVARWLNKPVSILEKGAQLVAQGDFGTRINVKSRDEMGDLGYAFNTMLDKIDDYATNLQSLNQAFERFVPREFLFHMGQENIQDVRLGDQNERNMTVVFADIRSFTALSETMTPKENFEFLNRYLGHVTPSIRSNHGFIDKFIGDAIMALFPRKPEDAIEGSIQMLTHLQSFNVQRKKQNIAPINIGIGIHGGRLMLGTIGEENRMEGTVIADAVNLTSRLEGLTKQFGVNIIISEETLQKAKKSKNTFFSRFLGLVRVKGKKAALKVFEVYNADSEEQIELKKKTQKTFETGILYFQNGKYQTAFKHFSDVLRKNPLDKPAKLYHKKISRR